MKKTATSIRCVPRCGFENTEVRSVDLPIQSEAEEQELHEALRYWFLSRGISDAIYAFDVDDNGFFAIINDEVYDKRWGTPIF
jgi:hypothetical protein